MAGGEFRLGTASIYMAEAEHTASASTSPKFCITWLHFRPIYRHLASPINGLPTVARRKLGLVRWVSWNGGKAKRHERLRHGHPGMVGAPGRVAAPARRRRAHQRSD